MARLLTIILLLIAPALAQSPCPQAPGCNDRTPAFSGRVVDAADGRPIASATVHYRGKGLTSIQSTGQVIDSTILQGEVKTGVDGVYTLPKLPDGNYTVRVSAPSYLAVERRFYTMPPLPAAVGSRPAPTENCMKIVGKPACTQTDIFHGPDTNFQLQPNQVKLEAMSDAALAKFALHMFLSNRDYVAAAFASSGSRLGFLTWDSESSGGQAHEVACVAWTYDLSSGVLEKADLPGSPLVLNADARPPDGFCSKGDVTFGARNGFYLSGYAITWAGDELYVVHIHADPKASDAVPAVDAFVLRDSRLEPVAPADRPAQIQDVVAERTALPSLPSGDDVKVTRDGRFKAQFVYPEDGGWCGTLEATAVETKKEQDLASGCGVVQFMLDRERDVLLYIVPPDPRAQSHFEDIVAMDLKNDSKRSFQIPIMGDGPEFVADQNLQDGALRVAYTIKGDCDPAASDYSQPSQPAGELGQTPNRFSVCFVTIPPAVQPVAKVAQGRR